MIVPDADRASPRNPDGRVIQIGYPDGTSVHYGYSARGEVTSVRDPAVAALPAALGGWQLGYDALGRPTLERDPYGTERRTSYTEAGFVDTVELRAAGALVESYAYSAYDALGNPTQIATGEGTTDLQFDRRSRLEQVAYPGGSLAACLTACERFGYDLVGNRTLHAENGIQTQYVIDADDRLTAILDAADEPLVEFEHDAAGRRTKRADSFESTYAYDALGRLRRYQAGAFSGSLTYTATDERTARTDFAGTTRYLGEWYETTPSTTRRLVHGPGIDNVLGQVSGANQVRTLLRDGTANVVRTALDGTASSARRWEAFGGVRSGALAVERGFAGRPVEGATSGGLVNVRARHYDPETGRFLQPDPLGVAADQLYAYAANDPYRFRDPTGLRPDPLSFAAPQGPSNPLTGRTAGVPKPFAETAQQAVEFERTGSYGTLLGGAAVASAAVGSYLASSSLPLLSVGSTLSVLETQGARLAIGAHLALSSASSALTNLGLRTIVAGQVLVSRNPALRGFIDGVLADLPTDLPAARTIPELRGQAVGLLVGRNLDTLLEAATTGVATAYDRIAR
jgi:RHS repeat-associated protein